MSYTEYESSTSIDQVKKSEQEPAKESADNEIAAAKDKSAQLARMMSISLNMNGHTLLCI